MSGAAALGSGKGHRDENFPVASWLLRPGHRAPVLAFYRFARAADDVADHPTAPAERKLALLEAMRAGLLGEAGRSAEADALRAVLAAGGLSAQHPLDLLEAFRRDVTTLRYADWDALMEYCRYSAAPVGRFVLEVHGESQACWRANDALCAALQVINHLQDCAKDFAALDRVYLPQDALAAAGIGVDALGEGRASPALRGVIAALARRTGALLAVSRPFAGMVRDRRLGLEIGVIQALAEDLVARLLERDPLSERVHHRKPEALRIALGAAWGFLAGRFAPAARAA